MFRSLSVDAGPDLPCLSDVVWCGLNGLIRPSRTESRCKDNHLCRLDSQLGVGLGGGSNNKVGRRLIEWVVAWCGAEGRGVKEELESEPELEPEQETEQEPELEAGSWKLEAG